MVAAAVDPSVSLQLEPLGTDTGWWPRWRREMALPPCRLVWIGDVVESPEKSATPHVEALVAPLEPGELQVVTLPVTALSLLSVGRVLKEKPDFKLPEGIRATPYGGPKPERRFIGFEFSVDVPFDAPNMSVVGADELSGLQIGALAGHPRFENPPLCVVKDDRRRLVIIPCWEIFRHYYAHGQLVSRLIFQFPSWKPETLSRLLRTFDGHRFEAGHRQADASPAGLAFARMQLSAIGRDAAVAFAGTGRAQIRAVPPFVGPASLECIAIPLRLGSFGAIFVQQILYSQPRSLGSEGLWWRASSGPRILYAASELSDAIERLLRPPNGPFQYVKPKPNSKPAAIDLHDALCRALRRSNVTLEEKLARRDTRARAGS